MKNNDNNIDAVVIRTYVLQNVSTKPKKIHLFDKLRTGGILEIGKEIYYALLDPALKLIPVTTRSQVLLFLTLSLGAVEMQGQHRDGQTANTLKTVTVDNYLDDHQWTTIPAADREAGLCIQDRATSSSLGADINNAGIFVQHTSSNLADAELSSTTNKEGDLTALFQYINNNPANFEQDHYNMWYNHQTYSKH